MRSSNSWRKVASISVAAGWLFVHGGWQPVWTEPDACSAKEPPTLWACFWYVEPGYPVVQGGQTLNEVFLDPSWSPIAAPIPESWVRSVKRNDGAWGYGGGPSQPLVSP